MKKYKTFIVDNEELHTKYHPDGLAYIITLKTTDEKEIKDLNNTMCGGDKVEVKIIKSACDSWIKEHRKK